MADLSREEFLKLKEDATRRMRSLYGSNPMPPCPDFVTVGNEQVKASPPPREPIEKKPSVEGCRCKNSGPSRSGEALSALNLNKLMSSPDSILILGLILLLMSDNADEKLILALVFIML